MKTIILDQSNNSNNFLYEQLYLNIKNQIESGDMKEGEKCPSVRNLSETLQISATTILQAYNQLVAEGYLLSKPGSGYYVESGLSLNRRIASADTVKSTDTSSGNETHQYLYDEEMFDFIKWKKCSNRVFTEYGSSLFSPSEIKGEFMLRKEISEYLKRSRGVTTTPHNIVISAGTQQIAFHLGRILKREGINIIAIETPGYAPVKSMFEDAAFTTIEIPVKNTGIEISLLPNNLKSSVYVNPSNQFPTGVVMPAAKRIEILDWAQKNNCYIIEDDYNSELRYFGQPLPPIKSLDTNDRVIYLGSFSSTLFPAIKISYMVLPNEMTSLFDEMTNYYTQTCSKAEQLTLALYMKEGYYYTTIRKKRALLTKKLQTAVAAFNKYGSDFIEVTNKKSGLTLTLRIKNSSSAAELIQKARNLKLRINYIEELSTTDSIYMSLYYSALPLDLIESSIKSFIENIK